MSKVLDGHAVASAGRQRVAFLLHRISRELREPRTQEWLALELSMAQLKLLFFTYYRGPVTVGQSATALGVSLPSASTTIDKLVRQGLLERFDDPADRRLVMNRVSDEGKALVERLREDRQARLDLAINCLHESDITLLEHGLEALAGALGITCDLPQHPDVGRRDLPQTIESSRS